MKFDRRDFLKAGGTGVLLGLLPDWARPVSAGLPAAPDAVTAIDLKLRVAHRMLRVNGRETHAIGINGTIPGPLVRLREGQDVRLTVINDLAGEDTSIHWHGLLVPFEMDGVPGISFPGIKAGAQFTYAFPVRQSGTYWYHSHS